MTSAYKETSSENDWMYIQTKKEYLRLIVFWKETHLQYAFQEVGTYARIDFHVHLNEIFEITSNDDTYLNKMWVCHVDFIIREENLMNILFALEVDVLTHIE